MALDATYIFKKIWAWSNTSIAPLPPDTQAVAGSGRTSIATGFPSETMMSIAAGGVPPYGQDVNGILRQITANLEWIGRGGQFVWDSTRTYDVPSFVFYGTAYYMALQSSTNQTPANNTAYWRKILDFSDYTTIQNTITTTINTAFCGSIQWFPRSTAPTGYLICNGAAVRRTDYATLFSVIGTTCGAGDGSTTFNVPDLIGRVMWGATAGIGTKIAAGLPDHSHVVSFGVSGGDDWYGGNTDCGQGRNWTLTASCGNASASNSIYGASTTVQPPALTLLPCIHI